MKAYIHVEDQSSETGFNTTEKNFSIRDTFAFDCYMADVIEISDCKIHGVDDLEALIKMLENARPCFRSGNQKRNFFK
jgi:hypothetical protein